MTTVSLESLNTTDAAGFVAALGDIYEHAPWVAQAAYGQRPFGTLAALHDAMTSAVRAAPPEQQLALIKGHPDLAGKAARAGTMTSEIVMPLRDKINNEAPYFAMVLVPGNGRRS